MNLHFPPAGAIRTVSLGLFLVPTILFAAQTPSRPTTGAGTQSRGTTVSQATRTPTGGGGGGGVATVATDTGGGGAFRTLPKGASPLKAVFLESSFPNRMKDFAVMTGHLAVPGLGEQPNVPATLSHRILTGVLREELGEKLGLILEWHGMHPDSRSCQFGALDSEISK